MMYMKYVLSHKTKKEMSYCTARAVSPSLHKKLIISVSNQYWEAAFWYSAFTLLSL